MDIDPVRASLSSDRVLVRNNAGVKRPAFPRLRLPLHALIGLWLLVAMVLLKAAVPVLATLAADRQGATLVEVCSVYGVRTVVLDAAPAPHDRDGPAQEGHQGGDGHCLLSTVLAGAAPAPGLAAVHLHAPVQSAVPHTVAPRALPSDPSHRWLSLRLHAPPIPA